MTIDDRAVRRRLRPLLDVVSTVALLIASGVMIWAVLRPREVVSTPPPPGATSRQNVPLPTEPVSLDGTVFEGSADAKVALVQFSEFQCPFCARFATDSLPTLVGKYVSTGRVRLGFRHLPLENIHPFAFGAGEISSCAAELGRFREVHDAFFKAPSATSQGEFRRRAINAGMDKTALDACLSKGSAAGRVREDLALAKSLGLKSTPSFLLGPVVDGRLRVTQMIFGARPVADFEQALEAALKGTIGNGGDKGTIGNGGDKEE